MINAKEAREIANIPKIEEALEKVSEAIENAAGDGKISITWRDYPISGKLYSNNKIPEYEYFKNALEINGYKVDLGVECRQFVDIWLDISWEEGI